MIRPTSLIKILNSLIGQHFEIDHVNISPSMMRSLIVQYRKIKVYEINFFNDYIIIYIQSKPIVLKSYGWQKFCNSYEMYYDRESNQFSTHLYIKLKHEHRSI
jgi:hypothetical protein